MKQLAWALLIGTAAGIIDIVPMLIKRLDIMFILSAMTMWMAAGVLISRTDIFSCGWSNGLAVAVLMLLPLSFLIFKMDRSALPQICLTTAALGAAIGFAEAILFN